jgi:hypothetical protein
LGQKNMIAHYEVILMNNFKNKKFYLTSSFRSIVNRVPSFLKHVYVYTYSEAYLLLFEYLHINKFYCIGNPYCYLIVDDPL